MFNIKKYTKKLFLSFSLSFIYALIVINDASEAIGVPKPPILVPFRSATPSFVNCDNSTALGTLLIIWLVINETVNAERLIISVKNSFTPSLADKLPLKRKKQTKVNKRM